MLAILLASSLWAIRGNDLRSLNFSPAGIKEKRLVEKRLSVPTTVDSSYEFAGRCLRRFALPQMILALLAVAVYHVQIVNRISSGYMVWYWWLAVMMARYDKSGVARTPWNLPRVIIRWMIVYGLVQGSLFASFLPPA